MITALELDDAHRTVRRGMSPPMVSGGYRGDSWPHDCHRKYDPEHPVVDKCVNIGMICLPCKYQCGNAYKCPCPDGGETNEAWIWLSSLEISDDQEPDVCLVWIEYECVVVTRIAFLVYNKPPHSKRH